MDACFMFSGDTNDGFISDVLSYLDIFTEEDWSIAEDLEGYSY